MPRDWPTVHAERAALADDLSSLRPELWATPSLCAGWTIREVVAHLTAAASLNTARWLFGVIRCRFDFDRQVDVRLKEQLGTTPQETLANFRRFISSRRSAAGPFGALLGETVVHAEDIRQPLGIAHRYPMDLVVPAADFYSKYDFTVPSKQLIRGLRLEATDGHFATGTGPLVSGPTVALVMVMAGRASYCSQLEGAGVGTLQGRLATTAP